MSTLSRLVLILTLFSILTVGCQPNATPTPPPAMATPVPPTLLPIATPTTAPVSPAPSVTPNADPGQEAISLSNVAQIEALATLAGHKDGVTGLVFLPNTARLASLSGDLVLTLWDIQTGLKMNTLTEPAARVYNVAFSPNGNLLAVGNPDNTIGIWAVENGQLIQNPQPTQNVHYENCLLA